MKRFLLTFVCCFPLLFSSASSFGLSLIGPNGEQVVAYEKYGPISKIETLWAVSSKLRPDSSVTIQQTLVAIYKTNPDAFLNGNVNKLISGSVINIPDLSYVQTQTDQEAVELLSKYSQSKKVAIKKPAPKKAVVQNNVTSNKKAETTKDIDVPKIQATETKQQTVMMNKQLAALKAELAVLNKEFDHVDEQLVVETEKNQSLKLKMQPLYDQINSLKEQLKEQSATQEKMQGIIDDYQAQLDKVKARPFSGEGFFNEMLRAITSSLTYLLIAILSPILLLIAIFGLLIRLSSKRKLAEQEKELAESTSNLMEESGQFDSLLTDDIEEEGSGEDLDFMAPPEEKAPEDEVISIDDIGDLENDLESIDLSDNSVISLKEEAFHDNEDAPVGIDALSEAKATNEFEPLEATDDDPFGIAGLTGDVAQTQDLEIVETNESDEEDLIDSSELSEPEELSEEDKAAAEWESSLAEMEESPEGKQSDVVVENEDLTAAPTELEKIEEALVEQETDIVTSAVSEPESSEEELAVEEALVEQQVDIEVPTVSEPESSEEDVAVEEAPVEQEADVEAPIVSEPETNEEELAVEEAPVEQEADVEAPAVSEPESSEEDVAVEDALVEQQADIEVPAVSEPESSEEELAVEEAPVEQEADVEAPIVSEPETNEEELAVEEAPVEQEADVEAPAVSEPENSEKDVAVEEELVEQDSEVEAPAVSEPESSEEDVAVEEELVEQDPEVEAPAVSEPESSEEDVAVDPDTLLAKQLSDVSFNEDVPLPKVEASNKSEFIDIETLLGEGGNSSSEEPYSEFNLDLGLDEFPDVINSDENEGYDKDDKISAQLDLARAYIEIDDKQGAKDILLSIADKSDEKQRVEIDKLLSQLP